MKINITATLTLIIAIVALTPSSASATIVCEYSQPHKKSVFYVPPRGFALDRDGNGSVDQQEVWQRCADIVREERSKLKGKRVILKQGALLTAYGFNN